jgi:hypothetical protein
MGARSKGRDEMKPLLGQELAAARMGDLQRQMKRATQARQAREPRVSPKDAPSSQGRFVPAGALRLGRAVRRLRSKPQHEIAPC